MEKSRIKNAVRKAVENICRESTTDVELFTRPFEVDMLVNDTIKNKIIDDISQNMVNAFSIFDSDKRIDSLSFKQIGKVLVPKKNNYDFRKCALIDVIDEIKYLSLVIMLASKIEKKRLSKKSNQVFSYRFNGEDSKGWLFNKDIGMNAFRKMTYNKSHKSVYKVMIECDIANFYDRLNLHRLESTLLSSIAENEDDKQIIYTINKLLLFWSNRDSYGLPVGSNASRILAEAALIDIDRYLKDNKIPFVRFVDDYRLFAKSAEEGHKYLSMLIKRLSQEGLFLNSSKTNIKDISNLKTPTDPVSEEAVLMVEEKTEEEKKIIRGYAGLVPTKFKKLRDSELIKYKDWKVEDDIVQYKSSIIIDADSFKQSLKAIVAQEKFNFIKEIPNILRKIPQFIPYFVDMLGKYSNCIDNEIIGSVKEEFKLWFEDSQTPEYILVYLVRIFDTKNLNDKGILLEYFRKLPRNSGDYIGRALLECFGENLERSEILEIREYYNRADTWEKHQILKIIAEGLSKEEADAFYRNTMKSGYDPLTKYIYDVYKN